MSEPVDLGDRCDGEKRVGGTFHEIPLGALMDFVIVVSSPTTKSKTFYYRLRTSCRASVPDL